MYPILQHVDAIKKLPDGGYELPAESREFLEDWILFSLLQRWLNSQHSFKASIVIAVVAWLVVSFVWAGLQVANGDQAPERVLKKHRP